MAAGNARLYQQYVEVVTTGTASGRLFQQYVEALSQGTGSGRLFQQYAEVLTVSNVASRLFQQYVEVITNPTSIVNNVDASNTLTFTQTPLVNGIYPRSGSNTITFIGEAVEGEVTTDTTSSDFELSQNVDVILVHNQSVLSTISFSQLAEYEIHGSIFKSPSNTLNLSQTVQVQLILNFDIQDTFDLDHRLNRTFDLETNNELPFSQNDSENKFHPVIASNNLLFDQDTEVEKDIVTSIISTLVFTSQALKNKISIKSVNSTLTFYETTTYTNSKYANNNLVFSQIADVFVSKLAKNTFVITQTVERNTVLGKSLHSLFQPFQTVHLGPNTFRRDLTSVLTLSQSIIENVVRGTQNTLTFIQIVTVDKVNGAEDFFDPIGIASYNAVFNRNAKSTAFFVQQISVNRIKALTAQSILSFAQTLTKQRIRTAEASNIFNLSDELVKSRYFETLTSEIDFSHNVDQERTVERPNTQALSFQQIANVNKVLHFNVGNQLVFKNSFQKYIGFIGSGPGGGGIGTVTVPIAQGIVVKKLVVLRGTTKAITLPMPEFDDTDAFTGSINIVRFKTGDKKVYKKDTERRVLDYTFIIQSLKVDELKAFIREYNATPFYLENWKGEIWFVLFNSNPFTFSEDSYWEASEIAGKNKFKVTLSFEGVRIN
jgi:hypothetical protein